MAIKLQSYTAVSDTPKIFLEIKTIPLKVRAISAKII